MNLVKKEKTMYMKRKILFRSTNIHFSKKKEKKMKRKLILTFLLQINSLIVRTRSFKLTTKKKKKANEIKPRGILMKILRTVVASRRLAFRCGVSRNWTSSQAEV